MRFNRYSRSCAFLGILFRVVLAPGRPVRYARDLPQPNGRRLLGMHLPHQDRRGQTSSRGRTARPHPAPTRTCVCPIPVAPYVRFGITASLWEPARMIETVKDPYCFPAIGAAAETRTKTRVSCAGPIPMSRERGRGPGRFGVRPGPLVDHAVLVGHGGPDRLPVPGGGRGGHRLHH